MLAFSFTPGKSWVEGVESKWVLNSVSIKVDLPIPVSPEKKNSSKVWKIGYNQSLLYILFKTFKILFFYICRTLRKENDNGASKGMDTLIVYFRGLLSTATGLQTLNDDRLEPKAF